MDNWEMARPEGFEPPTTWFEARYSIQLSYGRAVRPPILLHPRRQGTSDAPRVWQVAVAEIPHGTMTPVTSLVDSRRSAWESRPYSHM